MKGAKTHILGLYEFRYKSYSLPPNAVYEYDKYVLCINNDHDEKTIILTEYLCQLY